MIFKKNDDIVDEHYDVRAYELSSGALFGGLSTEEYFSRMTRHLGEKYGRRWPWQPKSYHSYFFESCAWCWHD